MPTRNVVLSDHQHQLIDALVSSGRYQNASEVLRDGLRLIEDRERREAARLAALQQATPQGWQDIVAGRHAGRADEDLGEFISALREALASGRAQDEA